MKILTKEGSSSDLKMTKIASNSQRLLFTWWLLRMMMMMMRLLLDERKKSHLIRLVTDESSMFLFGGDTATGVDNATHEEGEDKVESLGVVK